jgi:hypothetical protein
MRTKLTAGYHENALERTLDALALDLVDVSDEEIMEAAKELGMNPMMKGSAAFLGLRIPAIAEFSEFFESEGFQGALAALAYSRSATQSDCCEEISSRPKSGRSKRTGLMDRKH